MRLIYRPIRVSLFGGVFLLASLTSLSVIADTIPEYRKAEGPVSADLKGKHTVTDSIGELTESLLDQHDPFAVLPRNLMIEETVMALGYGLWFRAHYANNPIDGGANLENIRFILNYSYDF